MRANLTLRENRKHRVLWAATATVIGVACGPGGPRRASAANLIWDPAGTSTATGTTGSGAWDLTTPDWYNAGTATDSAWSQTSATVPTNAAIFAGPTPGTNDQYVVTLGTGLSASAIAFNTSGYQLTAASAQTLTVTGNLLQLNSGVTASIGANATVAYNQNGTITVGAAAASNAASGTLNIEAGGTLTDTGGRTFALDGIGTVVNLAGTLSLTGAPATTTTVALSVGQTAGSNVVLNVVGGTYTYAYTGTGSGLFVGNAGTGTVNLVTGSVNVGTTGSGVYLGYSAGGSGTFNLSGGTLTAPAVKANAGTGRFNFNGGTLQANVASTAFMTGLASANVLANGAVIDTNGFNVSIGQSLLAGTTSVGGGLTKLNAGVLTMTGTNTYIGATSVTGGTLALGGTGSINASPVVTVNGAGAKFLQTSSVASTVPINLLSGTLDGTGTVGAVNVSAGSVVANGNGAVGQLTFGALKFLGVGTDNITVPGGSNSTTPGQVVTGALTTSGTAGSVTLNLAGAFSSGVTYNLIQYGTFTGGLSSFTVPSAGRQTFTLGNDATNKYITVTASGDSPKWSGLDSGNWQVGSTGAQGNWVLVAAGTTTNYIQGDKVLFDDSAATGAVSISAASVSPASTAFNNSSLAYTLSSPGGFGISGTGGLVKNYAGSLTINTTNSYTGGTTINGGTVTITADANLGGSAGPLTINAGGTLESAASVATARAIALGGATSTIQVDTGFTYTTNGTIADGTAAGTLNVAGGGTLAIVGATSYTGGTNISNGTVTVDANLGAANSNVLVGPTGNILFAGSANVALTNKLTGTGNVNNTAIVVITGDETGFQGTWSTNQQVSVNSTLALSAGAAYVTVYNFANNFILGSGGTYNMGSLAGANGNVRGGNSIAAGTPIVLQVGALGTSTTYSGGLNDNAAAAGANGTLSLVKVGAGTLTLNIAPTNYVTTSGYSGGTTVNGGGLRVNNTSGSGTGSGFVTVNAGATLGGNGTIINTTGPVTVNASGTIAAGADVNTIGTLTTNAQAWNASGTFVAKTDGTKIDKLVMTGLSLPSTGKFTINLTPLNASTGAVVNPGTYVLVNDTESAATNPFATAVPSSLSLNVAAGVTVLGGGTLTLSQQADTNGYDLLLVAVSAAPEPTSLLLAGLAAAPLALGRRRRRVA